MFVAFFSEENLNKRRSTCSKLREETKDEKGVLREKMKIPLLISLQKVISNYTSCHIHVNTIIYSSKNIQQQTSSGHYTATRPSFYFAHGGHMLGSSEFVVQLALKFSPRLTMCLP